MYRSSLYTSQDINSVLNVYVGGWHAFHALSLDASSQSVVGTGYPKVQIVVLHLLLLRLVFAKEPLHVLFLSTIVRALWIGYRQIEFQPY